MFGGGGGMKGKDRSGRSEKPGCFKKGKGNDTDISISGNQITKNVPLNAYSLSPPSSHQSLTKQ